MKRITRRLMAGLLAFALVIALFPSLGQRVYAADGEWTQVSALEYTRTADADCAINKVTLTPTMSGMEVTAKADSISRLLGLIDGQTGYLIWEIKVNGTSSEYRRDMSGTGTKASFTFPITVSTGDQIQVGLGFADDGCRFDPTCTAAKITIPNDPNRQEAAYGYDLNGDYFENEVEFGKIYTGHKTTWGGAAGTLPGDYYIFTVSELAKDSKIRIEAEGTYWVKAGDVYAVNNNTLSLPATTLWAKNDGKLLIHVYAKDNWSMKITKEDYDHGKISETWSSTSKVSGKFVRDRKCTLNLTYTNGQNFGEVNEGGHIIGASAKYGSLLLTNNGTTGTVSYTGKKIGRDTITIQYGDAQNRAIATKKITVDVCPPKPSKPSQIKGDTKSIRIYHTSPCKNWMLQRYKSGKWVNVCSSKNGTTASSVNVTGLKANTSYKFRIYDLKPASGSVPMLTSPVSSTITVKTAPTTKPAISSVKISNVKNTYHPSQHNPGYWSGGVWIAPRDTVPYYTTSYTVTVTMKNTITGSYGRVISTKLSRKSTVTKVLKGNKKTYKYTVTLQGKYSASQLKGKPTTVRVCTDANGLIVGPVSTAVNSR